MATPESRVKAAVDKLLKLHRAYYLKPVQAGLGAPAVDYHGSHRGFAYLIEAKSLGKLPTPRQINTMRQAHLAGASCFLIDGDTSELGNWLTFPISGYISANLRSLNGIDTTPEPAPVPST